jgi:hypothetical protein
MDFRKGGNISFVILKLVVFSGDDSRNMNVRVLIYCLVLPSCKQDKGGRLSASPGGVLFN